VIWLLCTPGIIFLVLGGAILLSKLHLVSLSESAGWGLLGVVLMLAPVILLLSYGGIFIAAAVGLLGLRVLVAHETTRKTKIEVAIAFAISVLSAILVWLIH
jgi:hypothetical protein